jgi:predicted aspartyl protease/regulator of sirC expression with transglutaminase-like and TPR domain
MSGYRPLVDVKINGADALLVADSGAFYSMLTKPTAAQFNLPLRDAPIDRVTGIGGAGTAVYMTTVKRLGIGGAVIPNIQFLVGGSEAEAGSVGILGQNILGFVDTEYDFANGVIRLIRPSSDCRKVPLAYWAHDQAVAMVEIESITDARFHTIGTAQVNGVKIRVMFDSGAGVSMLTLGAAKRAGIHTDDPGVMRAGSGHGVGTAYYPMWIAPVASFAIGGEEIRHTKLRIADVPSIMGADMLLGPDFFLSHRIYVSNQQHKLYFTYNGGPVFNLTSAPTATTAKTASNQTAEPATAEPATADSTTTGDSAATATVSATAADADALSRSGMAAASRRDYERALADLTQACKLAPQEPRYLYERASIYLAMRKPELGAADLDAALLLKPDYPEALLLRADLHLSRKDATAAAADLDAADKSLPKESEYRFSLANGYERARQLSAAVRQLDLWIPAHPQDAKLPQARSTRCWLKALQGQDLEAARADCNAAVSADSKSSVYLLHRGFVDLRLGDYKKSVSDLDSSLKANPKSAWALYGRGIAKMRLSKTAEAQVDVDAAVALYPGISEDAAQFGINP